MSLEIVPSQDSSSLAGLDTDSIESNFEAGQARVRIGIGLLIFLWMGWGLLSDPAWAEKLPNLLGFVAGTSYFAYSFLHRHWVVSRPGYNPLRRWVVTLGDQLFTLFLMALSGPEFLLFIFVNPWVAIGNGLRFGRRWMGYSAGVAIAGLALVGWLSPLWEGHLSAVAGLILLNAALPAYLDRLLRSLRESRERVALFAERMRELAMRDALTGLPNRSALFGEIEKASSLAARQNLPLALLYFDLDGFKAVNDTHGHAAGDDLLREAASRVSAALRAEDVVSRLGGDEFVVLLQGLETPDRADIVADRILTSISSIDSVQGKPVKVSASIGGIVAHGADAVRSKAESLLKAADANMYQAKSSGKNRVVLSRTFSPI